MTNYECENRISDDEIISSLEVIATTRNCSECKIRNCNWGDCNCSQITANAALDLINRQQAEIENAKAKIKICAEVIERQDTEIERLKKDKYKLQKALNQSEDYRVIAESEAIKEFADRLKEKVENVRKKYQRLCREQDEKEDEIIEIHCKGIIKLINNLVKEYEKGR